MSIRRAADIATVRRDKLRDYLVPYVQDPFRMAFTRSQFNEICHKFASIQNKNGENEFLSRAHKGWKWKSHPIIGDFGYLERIGHTSKLQRFHEEDSSVADESINVVEDEDECVAVLDKSERSYTVQQHIAYSPTFRTPVFYFRIYSEDGAALPLAEIMQMNFFHQSALPSDAKIAPYGISPLNSSLPILSLGDHPALNEPYWCLHPCQSFAAVQELLEATPQYGNEDPLLRWLETWFLVLRSIVDIR